MSLYGNGQARPVSYDTAKYLFDTHKFRDTASANRGLKLANNTWLQYNKNTDCYEIVYHATTIVIYHPTGNITLNSGGWHTATTKERLNHYQNIIHIWQKNRRWFYTDRRVNKSEPFSDYLTIVR